MRIAFFASGNGSTFQRLVESIRLESLPVDSALLLCTNRKAFALERAAQLGIPTEIVSRRDFLNSGEHAQALLAVLKQHNCDFILLCGYMELVPPQVVAEFRYRIVNIHPALLPAFGGKGMYGHHVHEAVLAYGSKISGATVHFVDEEYDHGPIIAQQAVLVKPNDTPDSLAERVQNIEKSLYVGALRLLASKRYTIEGRKVILLP